MARQRTASAIQKSQYSEQEKEDIRLHKARRAAQRYRLKNKERLKETARHRMKSIRSKMCDEVKAAHKESRKAVDRQYYLKHQKVILEKADNKRWRAHVKTVGEFGWWTYRPRKGKLRVGQTTGSW